MDKKLTRTIGYLKNTGELKIPEQKVKEKKEVPKKDPPKEESKELEILDLGSLCEIQKLKSLKIVVWIKAHEEFKWGIMCTKLGIDRGNFQRLLKSEAPAFKLNVIYKIEAFLKNYGYAE